METSKSYQRLKTIFENDTHCIHGSVIAITGPWGVGKTFFWKNFIKNETLNEAKKIEKFYYYASKLDYQNIFQRKYAYVSLFGMESLSDIKSVIYEKLDLILETDRNIFYKPSKIILTSIKEARINHSGFNISTKLLDTFLFSGVKNVIICFDDFERISDKVSIKDVMGLINFLKLERNCDVILILDEGRAANDSKNIYQEYKEKVIDAEVKINSVEPLIRNFSEGMDELLINLMLNFANTLDIQNFRFFHKVIKLYNIFIKKLTNEIAYLTKKVILLRILQGYFIEDFGVISEYDWDCNQYFSEIGQKNWSKVKQETYQNFGKISYDFHHSDMWAEQFRSWFLQAGDYDEEKISVLVHSDLISEENLLIKNNINQLMFDWRNIDIKPDFCENLYAYASKLIGSESLNNLDFYRYLLINFDRSDLSLKLRNTIKEWVDQSIQEKGDQFIESVFTFGFNKNNIFHRYIRILNNINPNWGLPNLYEVVKRYIINEGWNDKHAVVLKNATEQDWYALLFDLIPKDKDFEHIYIVEIIKKMITQRINPNLNPQIRKDIFSALEKKAKESKLMRLNVDFIIVNLHKA